jgi:elongation factor 2
MAEELSEDIEKGKVGPKDDPKIRAKYLNETYEWDKDHAG